MYIKLKRLEFIITYQCSGDCKHCSLGDKLKSKINGYLRYEKIKDTIHKLSNRYDLNSIMCFGGEPLLYAKEVSNIIAEAKECNIPKRQIITNGYFTKSEDKIHEVAKELSEAGVTQILLSADAFHQETIPLEPVLRFAKSIKEKSNIELKVHPAWLVGPDAANEWNFRTKVILKNFEELGIPVSNGNTIIPSGNAVKYLDDYFPKTALDCNFKCGQAIYTNALDRVETLSIAPDGTVFVCSIPIGNIFNEDILEIIDRYNPYEIKTARTLMEHGVLGLIEYAKNYDVLIDLNQYHSPCEVCRDIVEKLNEKV